MCFCIDEIHVVNKWFEDSTGAHLVPLGFLLSFIRVFLTWCVAPSWRRCCTLHSYHLNSVDDDNDDNNGTLSHSVLTFHMSYCHMWVCLLFNAFVALMCVHASSARCCLHISSLIECLLELFSFHFVYLQYTRLIYCIVSL